MAEIVTKSKLVPSVFIKTHYWRAIICDHPVADSVNLCFYIGNCKPRQILVKYNETCL